MTTIRSSKPFWLLLVLTIFCCAGCRPASDGATDGKQIVTVSLEPQGFLTDRIGGDRIRTVVVVPIGREPENYQPTPEKVAAFSRAKVWFLTGMPFETALRPKLESVAPSLNVVDLRQGIKLLPLELHAHDGADHAVDAHAAGEPCAAGCKHQHGDLDPHIWLGVSVLKAQAETIRKALTEMDPTGKEYYRRNYDKLIADIETLREEIAELLKPCENGTVFVFHPAYGYFCNEFKLKQRAIEFEGKSPTAAELAKLVAATKKETIPPCIFVQPEFNQAPAKAIAEATGAKIVVHSPLDRQLLDNLRRLAEMIHQDMVVDREQNTAK